MAFVLLLWATAAAANQAPIIDAFTASPPAVEPGGLVDLAVDAHDPDCPDSCTDGCGLYIRSDLTLWSASGGSFVSQDNGSSASPYTASAQWQAPAEEGTYTLTVDVFDNGTFLCGDRQGAAAGLLIQVTTSPDQLPTIDSLTATPSAVFVGEESVLLCVASDPEGEPLTYTWQTDLGTVTPGAPGSATFVADQPGIATVTCTATDPGGGFGMDSVLIAVRGAEPETTLVSGLRAPQRLAADSLANLYVVDAGRGLAVVHLQHGELVYRLPLPGVTAVAVDWNDHLLVGGAFGLHVISRAGEPVQTLVPAAAGREIADVTVDLTNQLYAVLYRRSGTVEVYDDQGTQVLSFGSIGESPEQFTSPHGLAVADDGVLPAGGRWVVADSGHGLLKVFDASGALVDTFGGLGGGVGEFVQLDDVAVDEAGIVYASDSFQDWVQSFEPDGTLREVLGTYGAGLGEFKTATGLTLARGFDRLAVASTNASSVQVFRTNADPQSPPGPPAGSIAPLALDFGSQSVGSTSPWQTVVISNAGERPLGLLRFDTSGDFSHAHDCPPFLDAGASCVAQVSFAPRSPGVRQGALTVEISWGGPLTVALSGIGFVPADVVLTPGSLFFPDQLVNTVSPPEPVLLTNAGTATLSISKIGVSGDFGSLSSCPFQLPGGESCEILVTFAPRVVGDEILGTLSVFSDAAGSPHEVALGGASYGGSGILSVNDVEVDESAGEARFPVRLSLAAEGPVTVSYATLPGTAVETEDFLPVAGTLTFAVGETRGEVAVPIVDDAMLEPQSESFSLELSDPIGGELGDGIGEAVVVDDELCLGPNLLVNASAEAPEGPGGIPGWSTPSPSMAWTLGQAPPDPVEGEQFFYAGTAPRAEIFQDVPVGAYAAAIDTGDAQFALDAWVRSGFERGPDSVRVVAEYRDETNTTVLDSFDSGETVSMTEWLLVSDTRTAPAGTRWIRLRLLAEQYSGPQTDALVDAVELRSVRLPTISPVDVALLEGDVGTSLMTFDVDLACPYWQPIGVDFTTADGSATAGEDYLATAGALVIESGQPAGEVGVEILGDTLVEPDEAFTLRLSSPSPQEAVLLAQRAAGTILDDDGARRGGPRIQDPASWPDVLEIAGEIWDRQKIAEFVTVASDDPIVRLVRELVIAHLDLAATATARKPPVVLRAERLLARLATVDRGAEALERQAIELVAELESYNSRRAPGGLER